MWYDMISISRSISGSTSKWMININLYINIKYINIKIKINININITMILISYNRTDWWFWSDGTDLAYDDHTETVAESGLSPPNGMVSFWTTPFHKGHMLKTLFFFFPKRMTSQGKNTEKAFFPSQHKSSSSQRSHFRHLCFSLVLHSTNQHLAGQPTPP